MTILEKYIGDKRAKGEKLLSVYLTAGFPTIETTLPMFETIVEAGADLIELGIPFSDPLADGTPGSCCAAAPTTCWCWAPIALWFKQTQ